MKIPEKMIEEFNEIHRKTYKTELSDQEATESAHNLINFMELMLKLAHKDQQRKNRLKREPDGFPVDGQYNCLVCHDLINIETGWYSWYGQTCLLCRRAIENGDVPPFVCRHHDSYFAMWELKDKFGIHPTTAKKYIREKELKARTVLNDNGSVHKYIFLKKENPALVERYDPIRKSYKRHQKKSIRDRIRLDKHRTNTS